MHQSRGCIRELAGGSAYNRLDDAASPAPHYGICFFAEVRARRVSGACRDCGVTSFPWRRLAAEPQCRPRSLR
jgi:hypothetical protein